MSSKQRQRQLARAKWERQQERRVGQSRRHRRISLVVGIVLGLIVTALLVWLVLHIIDEENARDQGPVVPTDSFSTNLLTPTGDTGGDTGGGTGAGTPATNKPGDPTTGGPTKSGATKAGGN